MTTAAQPRSAADIRASFFPSIGAVNPALTAVANALRVGDHLLERMDAHQPQTETLHVG